MFVWPGLRLPCVFPVCQVALSLSNWGGTLDFSVVPRLRLLEFCKYIPLVSTCNKSEGFRRLKVGFSAVSCHSNARPQVSYNSSPDLMDPAAGLSCVTLGKTD